MRKLLQYGLRFWVNNFSGHSLFRVKITRNITIFMILRRLSNYTFSTDKNLDLPFFYRLDTLSSASTDVKIDSTVHKHELKTSNKAPMKLF